MVQKYQRPREVTFAGLLSGAWSPSACGASEWICDCTTPYTTIALLRCAMRLMGSPQRSSRMAQTVIVLKRAHFFSLDNDLIDVHAQTIGALGIAVYAVLARYANRRTGECWPAI